MDKLITQKRRINSISIILLIISLIYSPLIDSFLKTGVLKHFTLLLFLATSLLAFFMMNSVKVNKSIFTQTFISLVLMSVSIPFWQGYTTLGSYISVIIVFLLMSLDKSKFFEEVLKWTLYISVLIAFGETITGKYLYIVEIVVNGKVFTLDEKLFSGGLDIFRAKGIFEGPLTFAQFTVFMALMFFKSRLIIFIALLGALMTSSRMAIFVIISISMYQYFYFSMKYNSGHDKAKSILISSTIIILTLALIVIFLATSNSDFSGRLAQTFDSSGSASNNLRYYFWLMAITTFIDYDIMNMLVGNNGYYRGVFSNNAESGWLTLLVDNGILGFLFYFLPCIYILYRALKKKWMGYALFAFVFILVNSTMTFYLSASGNVLYWYLLLKWLEKLKEKNESF